MSSEIGWMYGINGPLHNAPNFPIDAATPDGRRPESSMTWPIGKRFDECALRLVWLVPLNVTLDRVPDLVLAEAVAALDANGSISISGPDREQLRTLMAEIMRFGGGGRA